MNNINEYDRDEEKLTRDLLESAGKRPQVPEEEVAAIKSAARAAWRSRYAQPRRILPGRRWLLPLAAALFGGVVLIWWSLTSRTAIQPPFAAARVERLNGTVMAALPQAQANRRFPLAPGQPLEAGSVIETRDGTAESRTALRLTGGQSLRLDAGSRVRLVSSEIVQLDRGAVYLDSLGRGAVTIRTAMGDFQPAGTQFEVRVGNDGIWLTRLGVREGRVRCERREGSLLVAAGEEVILHRDGSVVRGQIRPDDPSWDWVSETLPMLDIEGRNLRAFLDWVAREKGWKLRFSTDEAASMSQTIILHGSIDRLTPTEALRTVTLSSGFEYRVSDGILTVSPTNRVGHGRAVPNS